MSKHRIDGDLIGELHDRCNVSIFDLTRIQGKYTIIGTREILVEGRGDTLIYLTAEDGIHCVILGIEFLLSYFEDTNVRVIDEADYRKDFTLPDTFEVIARSQSSNVYVRGGNDNILIIKR